MTRTSPTRRQRTSTLRLVQLQETAAYWAEKTVDGTSTGAAVVGPGGLGKTYAIEQVLKKRRIAIDEVGRNSHITPLALYQTLYEHRESPLLLIDDCEQIYRQEVSIGILRSALWGTKVTGQGRKRVVTYSSSKDIGVPARFVYKGGIVVIGNNIPKQNDPIVEALLTRIPTVEFTVEPADVYAFMRHVMCKNGYVLFDGTKKKDIKIPRSQCESVIKELEARRVTDLRKLEHALIVWLDFKKNPTRLTRELDHLSRRSAPTALSTTPPKQRALQVFRELVTDNSLSTEEQAEFFQERTKGLRPGRDTGYDRSTYFRWKKKWSEGTLPG